MLKEKYRGIQDKNRHSGGKSATESELVCVLFVRRVFLAGFFLQLVISFPSGVQRPGGRLLGHRPGRRAAAGARKSAQVERGAEGAAGGVRYELTIWTTKPNIERKNQTGVLEIL